MPSALKEAGDIILPLGKGEITTDHILAEIGEVAAGIKEGRRNDSVITLFKSVGNAIQDLVTADLIYRRAAEQGRGIRLPR